MGTATKGTALGTLPHNESQPAKVSGARINLAERHRHSGEKQNCRLAWRPIGDSLMPCRAESPRHGMEQRWGTPQPCGERASPARGSSAPRNVRAGCPATPQSRDGRRNDASIGDTKHTCKSCLNRVSASNHAVRVVGNTWGGSAKALFGPTGEIATRGAMIHAIEGRRRVLDGYDGGSSGCGPGNGRTLPCG